MSIISLPYSVFISWLVCMNETNLVILTILMSFKALISFKDFRILVLMTNSNIYSSGTVENKSTQNQDYI